MRRWETRRGVLPAVLSVGAALRLWWVIYAARKPIIGDPVAYTFYGQEIARGHGYISFVTGSATAFFPVGYPASLAGVFWLVWHTPLPDDLWRAVGIFHLLCGVGTAYCAFLVGRSLFDRRVGLVAAALVALWPNLIYYTGAAQLETLFDLLAMAAIAVAVHGPWPMSRRRLVVLGLVLGAGTMVRPFVLLFIPPLAIGLVLAEVGWRRALVQTGAVVLVVAAVLTPWTIRNATAMHAFVPISTNLGDTACLDRHPGATGDFNSNAFRYCIQPYEGERPDRVEVVRNRRNIGKAMNFVTRHPLDEVRLWFWRMYFTVRSDHDGLDAVESGDKNPFIRPRTRIVFGLVGDAWWFAALAAAALAVPAFADRRHPRRVFFLLCLVALALVPIGLYGAERFKVPWLPLLAVIAAVALTRRPRRAEVSSPR